MVGEVRAVEGEEIAGDAEVDESEPGRRTTRRIRDPQLPTNDEVREHEKTRLPYRDWCSCRVRGRGREFGEATNKGR